MGHGWWPRRGSERQGDGGCWRANSSGVRPSPEDDAGELAELAGLLRSELLDLDVSAVDRLPDEVVPPGAKGVAAIAGWLAVQLGPEALRAVLAKVANWVTRNDRVVEVNYGGDALKLLTGPHASSRRRSSMAGSPGTRPAADPLPGPRETLIIATTRYHDPELRQLRAPAHDAQDLAEILADPGIGAFTVTAVIDADEWQARRAIDVFLSGRGVGDLVVVYLSCHGLLDRRNRLYFAAADTVESRLSSTGIPATWLLDQLEDCRARQQVLILDCCFSGVFAHGSKGDADLDLERRLGVSGRGQAVLTASRAGEYSFEGQALLEPR